MNCPHCGKELNTTTFVNPMTHIQGCQPAWQGVLIFNNNAACANACPGMPTFNHVTLNNGCNPMPPVTFIKF